MAFVLAQSLASYGRARENVGTEARVVNEMSEAALRLDDTGAGTRIQGDLTCYARAVRFKEWGTMDQGERAEDVSRWADGIQDELAILKHSGTDSGEVGRLIDLDSDRATARVARINESSPTNPSALSWLMLGTVLVSVVGLGLFVNVKGSPVVRVAIMATLTLVLSGTLYMIDDLDQPFTGFNMLHPVEMKHIQERVDEHLTESAAIAAIPPSRPCNNKGVATSEARSLMPHVN